MEFKHTEVMNFEGAFRGMRNPKNSWNNSDSFFGLTSFEYGEEDFGIADNWVAARYPELEPGTNEYGKQWEKYINWLIDNGALKRSDRYDIANVAFIGPNDMKLAQVLIKSGTEHCKFLRQIFVSVDITAPLYWWKEMDTYKIGTTANSTSTMHKITSKPITIDCFEIDDYEEKITTHLGHVDGDVLTFSIDKHVQNHIDFCEQLRQKYLETKDVKYWKELIRWLPESWLQTRTWTGNYEILKRIYQQRKDHKLHEWSGKAETETSFIKWIESLPYAKELIML